MANRIIQYRIAEAAVVDSFIPWVSDRARDGLTGEPPVVVVDHAQQISSLKARTLAAGITLMGVEWQTAAGLRRYLCQHLEVPFEPLGRENLKLILRVAAAQLNGPLAAALAADPSDALKAMDELGRSGRLSAEWQSILPADFIHLGQTLEKTGVWLPVLEQAALKVAERSACQIGPVILFGWGGSHFPDLRLISILQWLTDQLIILAPQPRLLGGDDLDEQWIVELEKRLGVESEIAQDPVRWSSKHEGFVSSLVMEEKVSGVIVPEVLVGRTVKDQASLVVDWVERQEDLLSSRYPVGCLVPGEGGSLYRLTCEFSRRGIVFHQETGEVLSSGGFHTFHKLLVRCFSTGSDIEEVLKLLEWMLAREEKCVAGLEYEIIRKKCIKRFNRQQRRSFAELWSEPKLEQAGDRHETALQQFSEWLEPWPEQVSWEEARDRWLRVSSEFGFGADYLEPVWSRLSEHLAGQMIASRYFFEYLESLLGAPGLWRDAAAVHPFAQVIITTRDAAVGRTWGALVFMDSQEGVWPAVISENPFLKDAQRDRLNLQRGEGVSRLMKTSDRSRSERQMVLGLMESCTGSVLFSGSLTDGRSPELKTFPNEWAAQVLLSSGGDATQALQRWEKAIATEHETGAVVDAEQGIPVAEEFGEIHKNRSDPAAVIDGYDFCFTVQDDLPALNASQLDNILAAPAAYALEHIFHSAPRALSDFERKEALLLGIWTHSVLAEILKQKSRESIVNITELYHPVVPPQPGLWMEVLAEKASWMVRSCLQELEHLGSPWQVDKVEWMPDPISFETPRGQVGLAGRLDLVLRSDLGEQLIIDFKTGKSGEVPTPKALHDKATGLQYIAYLLLTAQASPDRKVQVINPFRSQQRELIVEHLEQAQGHLEALALMVNRGTYPRRGPLRDEYGFSAAGLPLTTLPVDEEVLEERWQRFFESGGAG